MGTYAYLRNGASGIKKKFCPDFLIFILPKYVEGTKFIWGLLGAGGLRLSISQDVVLWLASESYCSLSWKIYIWDKLDYQKWNLWPQKPMSRHQNHYSSSFRMQDIARSIFRVGCSAPSGAIWRFSYFRWWHSWGFWMAYTRHNVVSEKPKFAFKPILPTPCIIIIQDYKLLCVVLGLTTYRWKFLISKCV